jgi:transposase
MQATELVEVDSRRLEQVLGRVEQSGLDAQDAALIRAVFASYAHVVDLVEDRNTTIRRLRQLLFGARTETTEVVVGSKADEPSAPETPAADRAEQAAPADDAMAGTPAVAVCRGHGRHGADAYRGATRIDVPHPTLTAGDPCPDCSGGIVYDKAPGVLVRITGQPPLAARVYQLQKLRCHLCGRVFTAEAPPDAGERKYDARAASMIALLKYGTGMPFNRVDGLQGDLGVPLPASTQWEIVRALARILTPAFEALVRQAAQGQVLHNDDTTVRILQLRAQAAQPSPAEPPEVDVAAGRRGLYTSGVVSVGDGHRVALFFSGRRHAGENLAEVLRHRADSLPPPIQMCDALARNLPGELRTIVAHCLAHARRQFVEIHDRFPGPCRHLLESLAVVYRVDAEARTQGLSPEARLRLHQEQSGPTLQRLHGWLGDQLVQKQAEPNSALGGAIRYLLRHWDRLTLFLRVAGAPLDNNVCERVLKRAILHRKNALFYRTAAGARVGDQLMSLIVTCGLNQANPFEYLTALQDHADELESCPDRWLPWNYREALA